MTEARPNNDGVSLLDHMTRLLNDMELRHMQRIDALDRLTEARFAMSRRETQSQAEKASLALAAADKAVSKAEAATEKRFESVNEFRATLSDQTRNFISRAEFMALRDASAARIADLSSRLDKTEGKAVGLKSGWVYLIGVLTIGCTMATLAVAIVFGNGR